MENTELETKYFNNVFFTDDRGTILVAAVRWISDAIALANVLNFSTTGKIEVKDVFGKTQYTREI